MTILLYIPTNKKQYSTMR